MKIEVSNGEIIDKLTIIQIKLEEIKDESKLINLKKEWEVLLAASTGIMDLEAPLFNSLYTVNRELWDIENNIREFEKEMNFGEEFIELARAVYKKNDERFEIKRQINLTTGSHLSEEKSYEKY
jgi:hypothetical protein